MRGGVLGAGELGTRWETQENDRQCHKVKCLFSQEAIPSRIQVRQIIVYDGDGIERPSSTFMFAYP